MATNEPKVKQIIVGCDSNYYGNAFTHLEVTYYTGSHIKLRYFKRFKMGFKVIGVEKLYFADSPILRYLYDGYGWANDHLANLIHGVIKTGETFNSTQGTDDDDAFSDDDDSEDDWNCGGGYDDDQPPIPGLPPMSLGEKFIRSIAF